MLIGPKGIPVTTVKQDACTQVLVGGDGGGDLRQQDMRLPPGTAPRSAQA